MKTKPIKKLSKAELDEGLTADYVNSIRMDINYSPVQLLAGDEPVEILECSTGYWGKNPDGGFLNDDKGKLIVFTEKECRIGRARYLMNHGKDEKKKKVDALIDSWKGSVRKILDGLQSEFKMFKGVLSGTGSVLSRAMITKGEAEQKISMLEPSLTTAEKLYAEGKIEPLLEGFGIVHFQSPMLTVKYDDNKKMDMLVRLFGKEAIDTWDGDMLRKYAEIEIEKQY